ncbi:MAG: NADH-quinone oxidoreductase subunit L [Pseudomonadota bacterium]|nr:NADH-quinone oxidoreductase subunit L [Pseudomonadota bacterium]
MNLYNITSTIIFAPLLGSAIAGFGQNTLKGYADKITILLLATAFYAALILGKVFILEGNPQVDLAVYTWLDLKGMTVIHGFWLDALTATMCLVVTSISLLVHIYALGYMHGESGYTRFFSYMSLFTFMMLCLVTADNLIMLFFGWEGVGLVSYLLIGFYYQKESAIQGSLKAFLVNRIGDMAFIIGIATVIYCLGTVQFADIFDNLQELLAKDIVFTNTTVIAVPSVIALCWFIGAMAKSAQMPLHVWLPESMEGPTPISALIHAATMVTAGVYVMCRFAPIFECAPGVANLILGIGASGALWLGLVGVVQTDIKRVIAYSTLSQLGYMVAAVGAGAYSLAIFHLVTHAFFKALLFLAAGSVIVCNHHEQSLSKLGGLHSKMPLTGMMFLIGALALSAVPPFAGFFSKEAIIQAVAYQKHNMYIGNYAYLCVLLGAFVTPVYIFRAFWLTFYGEDVTSEDVEEASMSILFPLAALSLGSCIVGYIGARQLALGTWLYESIPIYQDMSLDVTDHIMHELIDPNYMIMTAFLHLPLYLTALGIILTYLCFERKNRFLLSIPNYIPLVYWALEKKLGFDWLYESLFVPIILWLSRESNTVVEKECIDKSISVRMTTSIQTLATFGRMIQTGYLHQYVAVMVLGLALISYMSIG